jgi:GH15 family glucan-1,4-alpha-glucosidase
MGRPVMLGNGSLTVGLNEQGLVHDFYYPYVGLDNLTTARSTHHKIGVWIDDVFSWVDDGSWKISVDFEADALISNITMTNTELAVSLMSADFVDCDHNAFCRRITVKNLARKQRTIRLFLHQVFEISRGGRGDTAFFVPDINYILDYKGRCSLLVYGQDAHGKPFDQYSIGNYGIEGKEGTYKDAEDGELSNNAVEHGGVDSVIRFSLKLGPGGAADVNYWVVAADSQNSAEEVHQDLLEKGLDHRLEMTRRHWNSWLETGALRIGQIDEAYKPMVKKSLMVIKVHTDKRGGIIASCDSSIYNYGRDYYSYVWPRDGAYAIWPLIRLGFTEEPKQFFAFCRDILHKDGYMMHKYQPDKAIGSTWHPLVHGKRAELAIQEDETASILYMLGEYYASTEDKEFVSSLYTTLVQPAANFMARFTDEQTGLPHASYDLWEEKFLTNTYTAAITYQALLVAAEFAEMFEYADNAARWREAAAAIMKGSAIFFDPARKAFRKGYLLQEDGSLSYDNTLDVSSLYGVVMYGLRAADSAQVKSTVHNIETILLDVSPSGGTARYENDDYFRDGEKHIGNPWFVTSLWMAQYYVKVGRHKDAAGIMQWAMDRTLPSGILSEQINPDTSVPLSVAPLVWSHAEFINTALDLIPRDKPAL